MLKAAFQQIIASQYNLSYVVGFRSVSQSVDCWFEGLRERLEKGVGCGRTIGLVSTQILNRFFSVTVVDILPQTATFTNMR